MRESSAGSPLCYLRLQRSLRSRLIVCVMSLMAQGAHRGGQSPPPPVPPASNIATAWCLRLIPAGFGLGRSSVPANTALSPHPCGLPLPFGNVSAMLRPPAPAVSATMVNKLTAGRTNCRPGKTLAATRQYEGMMTDKLPGGAALARAWGMSLREDPVGRGMR